MKKARLIVASILLLVGICPLLLITPDRATVKAATWTANWIWQSADGPNNTWISFRKKVTLSAKPTSAATRIAAENMYWLYVNGQLVVKEGGLQCRPDLTNTYYDEIDIAGYLQSGENTIAVLAWYKGGNNGYTQRMASKGGFIFESSLSGASPSKIVSDNTWKIKINPAFKATSQQQQWSAWKWVAWPISYDARNEMVNWYQSIFDDSSWSYATQKGVPPVSPWNDLSPRTIPMWKDYGLTAYQNQGSFPASISSNTTITGIVGNNLQGSQYLKVNAPAGVKIKMYMNDFYYVEYYTKAGIQEFDSMVWTNASNSTNEGANTHWAKYEFSNVTGTVQILDLKFHQTSYNTSIIGTFTCNDGNLNTLWTKCKNTSFVCMRDIFYDCPNRERSQWWGDVSEQILYSFYLYDNNANLLAKKGFRELMNCQKTDGTMYTTAPGTAFYLPDQNMTAVIALWDYYMYTGDSGLLTELYPRVKKYIQYLAGTRNSEGMLIMQSANGEWNWIDWGGNMDIQAGSANTIVNAMFIKLMDAAKGMATVTGNTGDLSYYQGLQDPVKNKFNAYFWNSSSNAYVFHRKDGVQSTCIDDRSNAWAALAGMVDNNRKNGVLDVLGSRNDCSPYQERYVLDALFALGANQQAINRMRSRYSSMISSGAATLWEEFPANNSNNHAWSAGPLYLMEAFMLGIRPTGAGFGQFVFQPQLGDITSISAMIPSVKGNIQASISKSSSVYTQNLTSPANTMAIMAIPKSAFSNYNIGGLSSIVVGSTTIWSNGSYTGGVSGISWNGEDTNYVKFNVSPGTYSFRAYPTNSSGPAGYTWCANEGQAYTLTGSCDVAYGANGSFYYKYGVTGSITFNNATFGGDPCYGVAKSGYYKSAGATPTPTPAGPVGFVWCANEGQSFNLPGISDVAYGANGSFNYKYGVNGIITFNNATFGDPIPNVVKAGYYKLVGPTPTPVPTNFTDNFNDNAIGSAWSFYGSGAWSENGTILRQDSATQGDPCKAIISNSGKTFGSNHTILAKVYVDSWIDGDSARAGVSLFTGTGDGRGYNLLFHNNHSTVQFLDDGTAWGPSFTFNWSNRTWYWFKLRMQNGTLYGKVWQHGAAEPSNWLYTWTRSGRSGYPALNGGTSGHGGSCTVFFDDITVTVP